MRLRSKPRLRPARVIAALALALSFCAPLRGVAEELWLFSNERIYGLVQGVTKDGKSLQVLLPQGKVQDVLLEQIVAIRFLGRNPLLVQSGTQELRFVNGGQLRAQIKTNKGDVLHVDTAMAGPQTFDLARLKGFLALPLIGFAGRKAEELVEAPRIIKISDIVKGKKKNREIKRWSSFVDVLSNIYGNPYEGVVRGFSRTDVVWDSDQYLKAKPFPIRDLAGVRLADSGRDGEKIWKGEVQVRLWARDGSRVQGDLTRIHLGKWHLDPYWNPKNGMKVDLDEISLVQILGGRVQYLSQLTPVKVKEQTILAPTQPYRMDRSCQGDAISIAGKRFPWGIGVHADSELTFDLNGRFKEFRADVGIATRMGRRGSVIFTVMGDGKQLLKTPVIRGSAKAPHPISAKVQGVKQLTLKVTHAGDLDLGDVANWGSARVLR